MYSIHWDGLVPIVEFPDGYRHRVSNLLATGDSNTKLAKSAGSGWLTRGLSLAPAKLARLMNMCNFASPECIFSCLFKQGQAFGLSSINLARVAKTVMFQLHREWFIERLARELFNAEKLAYRDDLQLCCRLNVFSDYPWETTGLIEQFPDTTFYDYSKDPGRIGWILPNYHVTFSRSEINGDDTMQLLAAAENVAVVFAHPGYGPKQNHHWELPKTWQGFPVINGDLTDLRFTDPRGRKHGRVVGLKLKVATRERHARALAGGFPVLVG